ncbi:short subunit dehydrogenase-like uncharacterized protein [Amycolatopsis bartoniae]|nr:saccharopine dehydrogenase NADP-binding domain-containing protein [Amycolatopsis bartoniae]MBB2934247.1 short subunit dehydrogenase-like uncharacterized protein [Amycolatopsis bartoniae]TVT08452.1 saccharopine dehydrogenase [Amycolatopsis bartoniae]
MAEPRSFDVVLLGATGFTGALTAEYLARRMPEGGRWAIAGRNREKLEALRARLGLPAQLLEADVTDRASLRKLAESAKVVISTVGPYLEHGEPLVAACAEAGTDYVDLCGEAEFFDLVYLRHHETAARTGARIVHACGFDSVPHDLGVFYTVKQLPEGVPLRISGAVRTNATFSGGTYASALGVFSRLVPMVRTARERVRAEGQPAGRRVRTNPGLPHRDPGTGRWLAPLPTIDPQVVGRSARLLDSYGPDFQYQHYVSFKRLPTLVGAAAGAGALVAATQLPPVRKALSGVRKQGSGPSEEQRARSWFKVRFTGEGGGKRVVTEVAGGDPGYDETAKMLGESALALAFDPLPPTAGQVTPAAAMGDALLGRLVDAGMVFRVVA